jgi:glycosyltransferase involved in cell wall biosynthesis
MLGRVVVPLSTLPQREERACDMNAGRRLRVIHYHPDAATGTDGVSVSMRGWMEAQARLGADVTVASEDVPDESSNAVRWIKVRHKGRGRLRRPVGLGPVIAGNDVLVLHSGWVMGNVVAARAARRLKVPYVATPHGAYGPELWRRNRAQKRLFWALFERNLVARAAAVHVFFDTELPLVAALGARAGLVACNGVAVPENATWRGESDGGVLWLGRFDPEHKGLDLLVRALAALPPGHRPRLRLVGPDWRNSKAGLQALVDELGLGDWVQIEPQVAGAEKWSKLEAATAFVYPSRWEACGLSVLEAAGMGIPTLVTDYPLGRFLAERGAAIMVDASPAGIAIGLRQIVAPDARVIGERARRVIASEFSWDHVAASWLGQLGDLGLASTPP